MNLKTLANICHNNVDFKKGSIIEVDEESGNYLIKKGLAESTEEQPKVPEVEPKASEESVPEAQEDLAIDPNQGSIPKESTLNKLFNSKKGKK